LEPPPSEHKSFPAAPPSTPRSYLGIHSSFVFIRNKIYFSEPAKYIAINKKKPARSKTQTGFEQPHPTIAV
jgi:hypothetical protein